MADALPATIATAPAQTRREIRIVSDEGPLANLMDTGRFEHIQRIATLMASSSLLPVHLRFEKGNDKMAELSPQTQAANCFRIVNQALRWGFDPFAIIDETYVVGGKLGYQGKLVAAVINARANLKHRLQYTFTGSGMDRTVTVTGTFEGEQEPRTVDLKLGDAKTDNMLWRKDPDQKLIYSGVMKWARRHCPEVVMGVITDDDLERMANQPSPPGGHNLNDRLKLAQHEQAERQGALPAPGGEEKLPAQNDEPPKPAVDEKPAPVVNTAEMPFQNHPTFVAAVEALATARGVDKAAVDEAMKKVPVYYEVKSAKQSVGPVVRQKVYDAIEAEKFDWATGKIVD